MKWEHCEINSDYNRDEKDGRFIARIAISCDIFIAKYHFSGNFFSFL
jgi:hypothetical protein